MRHDGRHLPLLHAALWRPTLTIAPCCATTANTYHCSTLRHDDRHLPLLHAASWRPTAALYTHIKQTESKIMKNSPPQSDRRHPLTEMTGLPEPSNDSACTSQHNSCVPWQLTPTHHSLHSTHTSMPTPNDYHHRKSSTCFSSHNATATWLVMWHSGKTLVFDRRTFPVLCSTCSWRVITYVGKPFLCLPSLDRLQTHFLPVHSLSIS